MLTTDTAKSFQQDGIIRSGYAWLVVLILFGLLSCYFSTMNEHLHTLEYAQKTTIDRVIPFRPGAI